MGPNFRGGPSAYGMYNQTSPEYGPPTPGRPPEYYYPPESYGVHPGSSVAYYGAYMERRPRPYPEMEAPQYPADGRSQFRYLMDMRPPYLPDARTLPPQPTGAIRPPPEAHFDSASSPVESVPVHRPEPLSPAQAPMREEEQIKSEPTPTSRPQHLRRESRHSLHAILSEDASRNSPLHGVGEAPKDGPQVRDRSTDILSETRDGEKLDDKPDEKPGSLMKDHGQNVPTEGRANSNLWKLVDAATEA